MEEFVGTWKVFLEEVGFKFRQENSERRRSSGWKRRRIPNEGTREGAFAEFLSFEAWHRQNIKQIDSAAVVSVAQTGIIICWGKIRS